MKGTVPKRLDICYDFRTFSKILNFYFLIVVTSATQHSKFLTTFFSRLVSLFQLKKGAQSKNAELYPKGDCKYLTSAATNDPFS